MQSWGEKVHFWVWHRRQDSHNFAELNLPSATHTDSSSRLMLISLCALKVAELKPTNMTSEEKHLIADCRIMVIGTTDFIDNVKAELQKSGFKSVSIVAAMDSKPGTGSFDMIAEYAGNAASSFKGDIMIPIIYPFDFVEGAGAIVVMPGDDNELQRRDDVRLWAAEYMAGYCAFWNVEGCDWLLSALPAIREGKTSEAAQRTAAHICARIAANIAVGRKVKHFPRFYLCKVESGEVRVERSPLQ